MFKYKFELNIYYHKGEKVIPREANFIVFFRETPAMSVVVRKITPNETVIKNCVTMYKRLFPIHKLLEENLFFHSINLYAKHCAGYSGC